jgi:hypothetical protein
MAADWLEGKGAEVVAKIHNARYRDTGTLGRAADRLLDVAKAARDTVAAYRSTDSEALVRALERLAALLDFDPRSRGVTSPSADPPDQP